MTDRRARGLSRRDFLALALTATAGCLVPGSLWAGTAGGAATARARSYYLAHREELLQAFGETNAGAQEYLQARCGATLAGTICRLAAARFRDLLFQLPEVGGAKNLVIQDIPLAGWYVAFYGPMRAAGKSAAAEGRMIYDLHARELATIPEEEARALGASRFTPAYVRKLQEFCAWTQRREYPGNWVAYFVAGDGKNFDYGYDYTECAIVKYLQAQGAQEVAPYVCLNDFLRSRTYGTGLHRTKTIAQGDSICNFRYKQGRAVTQDWATEVPKFSKKS